MAKALTRCPARRYGLTRTCCHSCLGSCAAHTRARAKDVARAPARCHRPQPNSAHVAPYPLPFSRLSAGLTARCHARITGTGFPQSVGKEAPAPGQTHLEARAHHPPAHQPLRAAHEEEQAQPLAQRPVDGAARQEVGQRQHKREPQRAAPHPASTAHTRTASVTLLPGHTATPPRKRMGTPQQTASGWPVAGDVACPTCVRTPSKR